MAVGCNPHPFDGVASHSDPCGENHTFFFSTQFLLNRPGCLDALQEMVVPKLGFPVPQAIRADWPLSSWQGVSIQCRIATRDKGQCRLPVPRLTAILYRLGVGPLAAGAGKNQPLDRLAVAHSGSPLARCRAFIPSARLSRCEICPISKRSPYSVWSAALANESRSWNQLPIGFPL